eukprot:CAMPEP_0184653860 /NCGR_PEP_ID=MMETSP0308-20130426/11565_1 /TAXON_ID=38269 /ORGANISM="Gloeochaete witrockiana, Strain SAG 46.84" /LENGTH=376 /DNA_ID=CAMNT_0027089533 /DNA_START=416 /DNA_END=1546 /DNA_ORIENTATION=-
MKTPTNTKKVSPTATLPTLPNDCPCLRRLTAARGTILLSGYPGEVECRWLVDGRPGPSSVISQIYFELRKFAAESAGVDNIRVYNGVNSYSPLVPLNFEDVWWAFNPVSLVQFGNQGSSASSAFASFQMNYIINQSPLCSRHNLGNELEVFRDRPLAHIQEDYAPNSACRWEYAPSAGNEDKNVMIKFFRVFLGSGDDKIVVRSPAFPGGNIIGSFYNSTQISSKVYFVGVGLTQIALTTDGSGNGQGFTAMYMTNKSPQCNSASFVGNITGTVRDGIRTFGTDQYRSSSVCTYYISIPLGNGIRIVFDKFDTELDYDLVRIHAGPTTNSPLVGQYSGIQLPPVQVVPVKELLVTFITDTSITGTGWTFYYQAVQV